MQQNESDIAISLKSGQPRHAQVSDWVRRRIRSGEYGPHERLPSESQLTSLFGVSRVTVRRALGTLERETMIYRHQGLGSFVAPAKVPQGLVRLTDFTQDMERAGMLAHSRVLRCAPEDATGPIARALDIEIGSPVFRIDRLRLGDGQVIAVDRTWLPPFYAQLLEGHDLAETTIYQILETDYEIPVLRGQYKIEAIAAMADIAELLELSEGAPLLRIERQSFTVGEKAVYFQRRYYRSDRVAFELELARDHSIATEPGTPSDGMPLREFVPVFKRGDD